MLFWLNFFFIFTALKVAQNIYQRLDFDELL